MATPSSTIPSTISIYVNEAKPVGLIANVPRTLMIRHSKTVKDVLDQHPSAAHIVLNGAPAPAVIHVLNMIRNGHPPLRIGVSQMPFDKAVGILQAVNALDIDPEQPQVEGHVMYAVTQFKITHDKVRMVQVAFGKEGSDSRIYNAMVQAVAYNVVHNNFTKEELAKIQGVAKQHPPLYDVIGAKVAELRKRGEDHRKQVADKEARKKKQDEEEARR